MASPFPGMDPYLEAFGYWEDFHDSYLPFIRNALRAGIPEEYSVFIQERVTSIALPDHEQKASFPDIGLSTANDYRPPGGTATLSTTEAETAIVEHEFEELEKETYLEITRRSDRQLITVIELLSPSNKVSPGAPVYMAKRKSLLHQYVHLVEIDLLIRGARLPMRNPLPRGDYYALVSRAEERPKARVYAWTVRQPMPIIPIPLMAPDPDFRLDLGALFRQAYDTGLYAREIKYAVDPPAFLRPDDRDWAREKARAAGSAR
jgi:Protein of unknown function (DUF4058)